MHGFVPSNAMPAVSRPADELVVDLQMSDIDAGQAALLAKRLGRVVSVTGVLFSEKAAMRRLTGLAFASACLGAAMAVAGPAAADGLCDRLDVPAMLELGCTAPVDGDGRVIVQPLEGTFRALSRLSLRPLDAELDRLAWDDPKTWLERQMILDLDRVADTVRDLGDDPDSPFGSEMLRSAIELMVSGLEGLSRLPLAACGDGPSETELTCRFGVEPIGLSMRIMLIGEGDERHAANIRTFNEQRLRHFTAIVNSFDLP
jgi:hypothetical protein